MQKVHSQRPFLKVDFTLTAVTILLFISKLFIWIKFEKWLYAKECADFTLYHWRSIDLSAFFYITKLKCVVENV